MNKKSLQTRNGSISGGYLAGGVIIVIGIGMIVAAILGVGQVRSELAEQKIVGTPDSDIPGEVVDTGGKAKSMADVIEKHTLKMTSGKRYAEMPRVVYKDGRQDKIPEDKVDQLLESGEAIDNPQRQIWITETSLTTALNTAYFAERVAIAFGVLGGVLILLGAGLLILNRRTSQHA